MNCFHTNAFKQILQKSVADAKMNWQPGMNEVSNMYQVLYLFTGWSFFTPSIAL